MQNPDAAHYCARCGGLLLSETGSTQTTMSFALEHETESPTPAVGDVQAGPLAGVQPEAVELQGRTGSSAQAEGVFVELPGALDVVAEQEHVVERGDPRGAAHPLVGRLSSGVVMGIGGVSVPLRRR